MVIQSKIGADARAWYQTRPLPQHKTRAFLQVFVMEMSLAAAVAPLSPSPDQREIRNLTKLLFYFFSCTNFYISTLPPPLPPPDVYFPSIFIHHIVIKCYREYNLVTQRQIEASDEKRRKNRGVGRLLLNA